ncbi:FAD-dependent oxidoreductase [Cryobacterium sp. TMT2-15-1]|uniref:FAD-dependent oxidoreductase n=1 Tax=Cryobacterium sp. TMT2-15-1 TaxID=1259246 RepID=UPI00106BA8D2|nr:FAD-dependent oxidoreductase [Cryobacterium sp. TMT2-15-1]TFC59737.1 FAD-dependent oxidoreductase [Cryobacterium sp. TMT2-15-1]
MQTWDVVVVGAGVCGLTVAQNLQERGRSVLLLDKGSRPGGRLSSRPLDGRLLNPSVDTVRSHDPEVTQEIMHRTGARFTPVTEGRADGAFDQPAGDIAKRWAAGTTLRSTFVTHLVVQESGLIHVVPHGSGAPFAGRAVVLTAPVPQSVKILRGSGLLVAPELHEVTYDKRAVLLCVVDGGAQGDLPGHLVGRSTPDGVIEAVRVRHRDDAGQLWLEVFASPQWTEATWEADATFARAALLFELIRLLPGAPVVDSELKRWRYANAVESVPDATFSRRADQPGIFVAGDGFGRLHGHPSGVSRAVRSGLDVARALT